jgi:hypothetical protein
LFVLIIIILFIYVVREDKNNSPRTSKSKSKLVKKKSNKIAIRNGKTDPKVYAWYKNPNKPIDKSYDTKSGYIDACWDEMKNK